MLGKTKIGGDRAKDPKRFTKSPMKGNNTVTNVFTPKTSARKKKRRITSRMGSLPVLRTWYPKHLISWNTVQNMFNCT